MDVSLYFLSIAALAPLIVLVTGLINTQLKLKGTPVQVVSWLVGPALAFVAMFFGLGMFAGLGPIWTGVYGVGAALIANGVVSTEFIAFFLEMLKLKLPADK